MAFIVADRVRETSASIGTGDFNLVGAIVGYQSFSSAIGNGNTTYYAISNPGVNEWEVGIGTVNAGTLTRNTVLASSTGTSLVSFTVGSKDVFCTYPSEAAVFADNAVTLTNKTINLGSNTLVATSAQLASAVSDETGSGSLVFANSPALTSPTINTSAVVNYGTANQVQFLNGSKQLVGDADLTFDGTTLSATNITSSGSVTLSGGTANGVAYLNGSKVLTTGSALTFDGTNLGVGGVGTAFGSGYTDVTITGTNGAYSLQKSGTLMSQCAADSAQGLMRLGTRSAHPVQFTYGDIEQMRLTSTGLGIGTSSPGAKLVVNGGSPLSTIAEWNTNATAMFQTANPAVRFGVGYDSSDQVLIQAFDSSNNPKALYLNKYGGSVIAGNGALTLNSSGNLGLGVTPSAWSGMRAIEVGPGNAIVSNTASGISQFRTLGNCYYNGSSWVYKNTGYAFQSIVDAPNGNINWQVAPSGTAGNAISFTQAMTLDASGNLLVGRTSGAYRIDAAHSSAGEIARFSYTGGSKNPYIAAIAQSDAVMFLDAQNSDNTVALGIRVSGSERMRIDSSGNVLVGITSTSGFPNTSSGCVYVGSSTANTDCVQVNFLSTGGACYTAQRYNTGNFMWYQYSGGNVGSISTNGTATSFNTSSDYRLKENIQPMQNALARNALLKPCTYSWKADGSTGEGFIAHELQAVCPDAVTGEKDAVDKDGKPVYQGVDTSFLVGHLVACIQELKAELDQLKAKVG